MFFYDIDYFLCIEIYFVCISIIVLVDCLWNNLCGICIRFIYVVFGMKIIFIFGVKVVKKVIKGEGGGMLNKSLIKLFNL